MCLPYMAQLLFISSGQKVKLSDDEFTSEAAAVALGRRESC